MSSPPELDAKRKSRAITGLIGLVVGLAYLREAMMVPRGTMAQPGAGIYPIAVGALFVAICALTIVEALRSDEVRGEVELPTRAGRLRVIWMGCLVVGYAAAMPLLGQYISAAIFMSACVHLLRRGSILFSIATGSAAALSISWFFIEVLNVRLPSGSLI